MRVKYKARRPLKWFIGLIGKEIIRNNTCNLFEPPVLICSEAHAKALHAHQDKGHRYSLIITK